MHNDLVHLHYYKFNHNDNVNYFYYKFNHNDNVNYFYYKFNHNDNVNYFYYKFNHNDNVNYFFHRYDIYLYQVDYFPHIHFLTLFYRIHFNINPFNIYFPTITSSSTD